MVQYQRAAAEGCRQAPSMHVECLHPYGEADAVSESNRAAAGHPRSPHSSDAPVGAAARIWNRAGHPGRVERRAAGRHGIALSRPAPARKTEVDHRDMEVIGQQTTDARLPVDGGRTPATGVGTIAMA